MRILIAEDDRVSAKVLEQIVSSYAECKVVNDGMQAFDIFCEASRAKQPFDLLFLDIMMPEVDGQEVLAAIREYEAELEVDPANQVKVVMVTSLDDGQNLYHAHSNNCSDYLLKPVEKDRIVNCLRKCGLIS